MKTYNVYGIGHALVDIECHVDEPFLDAIGLQKGSMTLVDDHRQSLLTEQLKTRMIHRASGGSASNTMIGLAQLGGKCFHSCKIADDALGHFFTDDMRANGVENEALHCDTQQGTTGRCLVMITPDAERTLCTHLGVSETFSVENLSERHLAQSEYLYIEGYLVSSPTTCNAAIMAKNLAKTHGVRTALTFSDVSMIQFFRSGMDALISGGIDLLFCNENEALCYAGTDSLEVAIQRLKEISTAFCLTLGPRGALLYDQGSLLEIPGIKVNAVDTNGAGDLFAGAFLYGITHNQSIAQSGHLAIQASAQLVTQYGARLQRDQAIAIKKNFGSAL
ncbi:MAG: adenosine kinase [Nitrospirae bacterium]|nr:adenosine kinase [Magnetococcales bacterium]HAT50625.1 adenosine kinase [Alphaproteobacteria bacterium]